MEARTLVTGSQGLVGRVLVRGLRNPTITFTDRRTFDVSDPLALRGALQGHDQLIHLASPRRGVAWTRRDLDASVRMAGDVLDAAREASVKRVILPSSVRATSTAQLQGIAKAGIMDAQPPDTEYGRSRLRIEELGRRAAQSGMEIICIRLGSIRHPDAPLPDLPAVWLSHEDCVSVFRACASALIAPGRFSVFYAVSDLPTRVLDFENPFGWIPRTNRVGFRRRVVAAFHRINTGVRGRLQIRTRLKSAFGRIRN